MSRLAVYKKTRPQRVCDRLRREIVARRLGPGERLAPMKSLARRFQTSVPTVQRALDQLQAEGLVGKRHGSGTFVAVRYQPLALRDSVVLCIGSGHVWGDLTEALSRRLHETHRITSVVDVGHANAPEIIERLGQADAGCFVCHANRHFPFDTLRCDAFKRKWIVSVVDWDAPFEIPNLARVLTDHESGLRQVTDHLMSLGHRRLLVVGTPNTVELFRQPDEVSTPQRAFYRTWAAAGGTFELLPGRADGEQTSYDEDALVKILDRPHDSPTAIFALRDVDVHGAQRLVRRLLPHRAPEIAIVGYYNTPWSLAGEPPITTVDLDLPAITDQAMRAIEQVLSGQTPQPATVHVPPRFIVRGTSVPRRRS